VPLVEQELFTLPEHMNSHPVFSEVFVTRSLVFSLSMTWDRHIFQEKFEDTTGVIRIRKSKKDKQYGQNEKNYVFIAKFY
jgi:hypothetical protein